MVSNLYRTLDIFYSTLGEKLVTECGDRHLEVRSQKSEVRS
nr:hypothetical protein [Okeania sp. SIO2F4]